MKSFGIQTVLASILIALLFLLDSCESVVQSANAKTTELLPYEEISDFEILHPFFQKNNDTVYVINFWATTCPPCLKEMPHFEQLQTDNKDEKLRILMINLDQKKDLEKRLTPFMKRKQIKLEVLALTDPNATKWTEMVNPNWWGALPYTVIYKNDERKDFFESFENYESLFSEVAALLK